MRRRSIFALSIGLTLASLCTCVAVGAIQSTATVDKNEAQSAFQYLNQVRQNPAAFGNEIGADLSQVQPRPALVWYDELARVAELKAQDMANRNYFGHVTPEGYGINVLIAFAGYTLP